MIVDSSLGYVWGQSLNFISYSILVGSDVSLVWQNLPFLETYLTKIPVCSVDFTSEIRAFVILLSLIAGNWKYGVGMSTNAMTSLLHENLSDVPERIGDLYRIELGAQVDWRMIPFSFSFPCSIHRLSGPSSCLLSGCSGILVLEENARDGNLKSVAEVKNTWS
jgi:hypothetical protein